MPDADAQHRPEDLADVKALLLKIRGKMPVYGVRNRVTGELLRVFPTARSGDARIVLTVGEDLKPVWRSLESLEADEWHTVAVHYPATRSKSADKSFVVTGDHPSYAALRSRRIK